MAKYLIESQHTEKEVNRGGWGIGGKLSTPDHVRALTKTLSEVSSGKQIIMQ